jgi:hypothetical protein
MSHSVYDPLDNTFDEIITRALEEWHVPGMSVVVLSGDRTFSKVTHPSLELQIAH